VRSLRARALAPSRRRRTPGEASGIDELPPLQCRFATPMPRFAARGGESSGARVLAQDAPPSRSSRERCKNDGNAAAKITGAVVQRADSPSDASRGLAFFQGIEIGTADASSGQRAGSHHRTGRAQALPHDRPALGAAGLLPVPARDGEPTLLHLPRGSRAGSLIVPRAIFRELPRGCRSRSRLHERTLSRGRFTGGDGTVRRCLRGILASGVTERCSGSRTSS
jgi:hypothetical protein